MRLWGWFSDLLSDLFGFDDFNHGSEVNPATGLPMMDGGVVDVAGNPYGMDLSDSWGGSSGSSFGFGWDD